MNRRIEDQTGCCLIEQETVPSNRNTVPSNRNVEHKVIIPVDAKGKRNGRSLGLVRMALVTAVLAVSLTATLMAPWPTLAQQAPAEGAPDTRVIKAEELNHELWRTNCQDSNVGCIGTYSINHEKNRVFIAQITKANDGVLRMTFGFPHRIRADRPIIMQVDTSKALRFPLLFCDHTACMAQIALEPEMKKLMMAGSTLYLQFWMDLAGHQSNFQVSLRGFTRMIRRIEAG